jgi:hypothetical protein
METLRINTSVLVDLREIARAKSEEEFLRDVGKCNTWEELFEDPGKEYLGYSYLSKAEREFYRETVTKLISLHGSFSVKEPEDLYEPWEIKHPYIQALLWDEEESYWLIVNSPHRFEIIDDPDEDMQDM